KDKLISEILSWTEITASTTEQFQKQVKLQEDTFFSEFKQTLSKTDTTVAKPIRWKSQLFIRPVWNHSHYLCLEISKKIEKNLENTKPYLSYKIINLITGTVLTVDDIFISESLLVELAQKEWNSSYPKETFPNNLFSQDKIQLVANGIKIKLGERDLLIHSSKLKPILKQPANSWLQ
ncbi:MAG: hypothetical protein NZ108_03955, partial [Bacteroidia bacterium]|nr:hypothetical protein [Bacteroidia bacterium]